MLGVKSPVWLRNAIAQRNMPIIAVGAFVVAVFSTMLAFCLFTGTPCPVDGFDEAAYDNPGVLFRYKVTSLVTAILLFAIAVFGFVYHRKKWNRPVLALVVSLLCSFLIVMLFGIADSGSPADRQVLIFASIQFLIAGLIVFNPIVALAYFAVTFFMFATALDLSNQLMDATMKDLIYLAFIDVFVCWVVYGLFMRARGHEEDIVNVSRRDELTGARNRHSLREDFPVYVGSDIFIMFCDIDDFKRYNDEFDHSVGDHLLREFFEALREAFGDECVYRYGGDEFLVVSPDLGIELFERKLGKVKSQLADVKIGEAPANLHFSGGIVRGTVANYDGFRAMLHLADENLLEAKRTGKDRVVLTGMAAA